MARVNVEADVELDEPTLLEGFPGVGLVGKIAVDHLVGTFEMERYATVHCEGLPRVVTYRESDPELTTPVRLYADADRDLLALQSDVPVQPAAAVEFAGRIADWFTDQGVTPLYLSGRPVEKDDLGAEPPGLTGVAAGDGRALLERAGIAVPAESGLVTGPTGALLAHAVEADHTAVGLIVESDPGFPDPEAARVLIKEGIEPLAGIEAPIDDLVESAGEIRDAKEELARRMQDVDEESTRARPLRMYQ
jgi:uncharacterized protein